MKLWPRWKSEKYWGKWKINNDLTGINNDIGRNWQLWYRLHVRFFEGFIPSIILRNSKIGFRSTKWYKKVIFQNRSKTYIVVTSLLNPLNTLCLSIFKTLKLFCSQFLHSWLILKLARAGHFLSAKWSLITGPFAASVLPFHSKMSFYSC